MKSYIFWYNFATKDSDTSIHMFSAMLDAMEYWENDYSEYILRFPEGFLLLLY